MRIQITQSVLTAIAILLTINLNAQNPYKSLGIETEMLTLSNGKYVEFFPNDTLQPIGNVMYNRVTDKVVAFLEVDTFYMEYNLEPEVMSRWLSPDPLAAKYPSLSPYVYVANNPLKYIDPDGMRIVLPNSSQANVFASDLNRIYQNKYGVNNAFNVVTRDVQVSSKNPEYGFLDRINPFSNDTRVY